MRLVKYSIIVASFILQLANVGISFYEAISNDNDNSLQNHLAIASLVLYMVRLSLDLGMACHFAFIAISFVKMKLSNLRRLEQDMNPRQKVGLIMVLVIFLLNINSCFCRIFMTYYGS